MPTAYARYEPTTDRILLDAVRKDPRICLTSKHRDVQVYRDAEATQPHGRFPWHYTKSKPRKSTRTINLDCARYNLIWLPDLS